MKSMGLMMFMNLFVEYNHGTLFFMPMLYYAPSEDESFNAINNVSKLLENTISSTQRYKLKT